MERSTSLFRHSRHIALALLTFMLGLCSTALAQSSAPEPQDPVGQAFREAQWIQGPGTAPLERIAEVRLPADYLAAQGDDTRRIMEAMHNPPTGREVGVIFTRGGNWFVVFEFDDMGYIKDDEKGSLDADAMLDSIKRGTEASNKERAKRGWSTLTIVGWEQKPRYDPQTHNLTWAVRGESQGAPVINYNTRLLGRRGVMRVTLVADPAELSAAIPQFQTLLAGYTYTTGNRYLEWVPGDKVAKIGLTALVTGGAAAVAVKSGFAKSLWKILLAAGAGSLLFVKKLLKRSTA